MSLLNPKNLDLHLLRCLQTLIAEAHVTRAAERLDMTQPAMSVVLSKLRTLYGDPLLVRTEKGMVPTPRALEVATQVRAALLLIEQSIGSTGSFEPLSGTAHFRMIASESVILPFVPLLVARLRVEAPAVSVSVQAPDLTRARQDLEEGDADFVLAFVRAAFEGLRSLPLFKQRLVVIAAGNHPDIRGRLTLEQYTRYPHACYVVGRGGTSMIEARVDEALAGVGARRSIATWLPSALSSPAVIAASDLIATVPERVAHMFAGQLGLQVLEPPLHLPDIEIAMYWHERLHNSAAHRWMRETMRATAERLEKGEKS